MKGSSKGSNNGKRSFSSKIKSKINNNISDLVTWTTNGSDQLVSDPDSFFAFALIS